MLAAWIPSVLVSSKTSISCRSLAPSSSAARMCARVPGVNMCVAAESAAM